MEHLPPVGWADVATKRDIDQLPHATKQDLDQLEQRFNLKLEAMELKILATVRGEMATHIAAQTRTMVLSNTALALTVAGLAFGAAQLV